jgi:hypothetical protein
MSQENVVHEVRAGLDLRRCSTRGIQEAEGGAMDERQTRDHVQQHANAVARGDLDAAVADFCEELRPQAPQTAQDLLPLPCTGAEVLSVEIGDSEAVAMIRYSGDTGRRLSAHAGRTKPAAR